MAKNLYHSVLVLMGRVPMTIKGVVSDSKFNAKEDSPYYIKPGEPGFPAKGRWIPVVVAGVDYSYTLEHPGLEPFFTGTQGRTFVVEAKGSRKEATISYIGEAAGQPPPVQAPPTTPAQPASPPPTAGRAAPPVTAYPPPVSAPPAAATPPPSPASSAPKPILGAKVGACLNLAVTVVSSMGTDPLKPDDLFYGLAWFIASKLERVSSAMEAGHLAPKTWAETEALLASRMKGDQQQ